MQLNAFTEDNLLDVELRELENILLWMCVRFSASFSLLVRLSEVWAALPLPRAGQHLPWISPDWLWKEVSEGTSCSLRCWQSFLPVLPDIHRLRDYSKQFMKFSIQHTVPQKSVEAAGLTLWRRTGRSWWQSRCEGDSKAGSSSNLPGKEAVLHYLKQEEQVQQRYQVQPTVQWSLDNP